jgi:branched-chain amino acid transport system substrate-binding protein
MLAIGPRGRSDFSELLIWSAPIVNEKDKEGKMNNPAKHLKLTVCIMLSAMFLAFPLTAYSKDKIRIGQAIALSGPFAPAASMTQILEYDMWIEEVNAKGGIYVKEYGKRLPVELIRYDDKSDVGACVKLVERLILKDKVDLLFPPWGTGFHFAVAPVVTKYQYPIIGPTVSSMKLKELAPNVPYLFAILNQPDVQGKALVDLLKDLKVKSAAVIHHSHLHGIESAGIVTPQVSVGGIDVALFKSYPMGAKDLSPLLKEVKAANVDALLVFSYPPGTFMITAQAKAIGLNPKVFFLTVGTAFPTYRDKFGASVVEGIMGAGAWNKKVPYAGAKEYFDRHVKRWGKEPDRWGTPHTYASVQVLEQAIEKVGSLDRKKIRDAIATMTFPTIIGPVKFVNQFNIQSPGEVGQWQNGEFEIVSAKEKRRYGRKPGVF